MPSLSEPKKLSAARTQFTVTFTEEEMKNAEETTIRRLGQNVNVPGFRPGKAPLEALKSKLRQDVVLEEMVRDLLPNTLASLATEHQLQSIIPPAVQIGSLSPLTVTVTFVGKPEAKVKGLEKIKIDKTAPKVDEKDVGRMVDYILDQHKTLTEVDRPTQEGDQVTMDFVGVDTEGKEIEGTRSQGYQVKIGSKTLIPGFEDQLVGLKKGERKSFQITFPEKYQAEHLRGKQATFTVDITNVHEVQLPALTDEFAKTHLHAESAGAFKSRIEQSMRDQEESIDRQRREEKLLEAITDATTVELADELVDQEARGIVGELREQLSRQGTTLEQWMQETDRTPEKLEEELGEQARRRLKLRFGMEQALDEKKIEVTDAEMQTLVQELLTRVPDTERARAAAEYIAGSEEYERLKWRRRVERFMEEMLR